MFIITVLQRIFSLLFPQLIVQKESESPRKPAHPPPQIFRYHIADQISEPILPPSVQIFSEFEKFRTFCSHPHEFTALRSYCILRGKQHDLQFVLEMVHVCDYMCQAFLNAESFFLPNHVQILLSLRQLPRSVLVVNGRFSCSQILPHHQANENPLQWVHNALSLLWQQYCLPNSHRKLTCVKGQYWPTPHREENFDLRIRLAKLLDCMAVSYCHIEKLLRGYSVKQLRSMIHEKTQGSHVINSASLYQQWEKVRRYELQCRS